MDVLVSLAIHGIWIPAIPAGMTLTKQVGVCNPDPERLYIIFEVQNIGDGVANPITLRNIS
jgi:hypothetical protein